jgi:ribose transport system substrate-binding protein
MRWIKTLRGWRRYVAGTGAALLAVTCVLTSGACARTRSGHKPVRVALVGFVKVGTSPFYGAVNCGARDAARRYGVKLTVSQPKAPTPQAQLPLLQAAIATKPDAIILAPTSGTALTPTIKRAMAKGIKLVLVDQTIEDTTGISSQISASQYQVGYAAAKMLAKAMGGKGKAMALSVPPGIPLVAAREAGFKAGLRGTGVTFADVIRDPKVSGPTTAALIKAAVAADPDISGFYGLADVLTNGAIAAARESGKTGTWKITSTDASKVQVEQLKKGQMDGLVGQVPFIQGSRAVEMAYRAATGRKVRRKIVAPVMQITPQNVSSSKVKPYEYLKSCD